MKRIVVALCAFLATCSADPVAAQLGQDPDCSSHKTAGSVLEIIRPSDGHIGAGVQVRDGLVITAAHVVGSDGIIRIMDDQHCQHEGLVLARNLEYDIAFVVLPMPTVIWTSPLGCITPTKGFPVVMVGNPFGREFVPMHAAVKEDEASIGQWHSLVQMNKNSFPGMSGAPAFSQSGQVVALVVAEIGDPRLSYGPAGAVPGAVLCRLRDAAMVETQ